MKQVALTPTETKIIRLICRQFTNREMAEKLGLSIRTVEGYRAEILKKIKVRGTAGIVVYAYKTGIEKV